MLTQKPTKLVLTREEETLLTSKDQAYARLRYKTGLTADGTIVAREVEAIHDSGAYNVFGQNAIMKMAALSNGPYIAPNFNFDGYVVYTNKPSSAAMRGYNVADAHFGFEVHADEIAYALGMDPLEWRFKNFIKAGDSGPTQSPVKDSTVRECMRAAAEVMGWQVPEEGDEGEFKKPTLEQPDNPYKKRGIGVCAGWQGTGATGGGDPGMAEIEVLTDGNIVVRTGAVEIGAGERTALAMMAAEELGVPIESITMNLGDTEVAPFDLGTLGNRITYINGQAVRKAAQEVRSLCIRAASQLLDVPEDQLDLADGVVFDTNNPETQLAMGEVAGGSFFALGEPLIGRGGYLVNATPLDPDTGEASPTEQLIFAAFMCEVEVDTRTGVVDIIRSVLVHDVGKAINPLFVEGQMDGGMAFGVANALMEDFYPDYPKLSRSPRGLHEYKIPTMMDIHDDHTNVIVEIPSDTGPFGAKSLGEYTANLQAPAIINAIHDAIGIRVRDLPATPEKLLRLIKENAES